MTGGYLLKKKHKIKYIVITGIKSKKLKSNKLNLNESITSPTINIEKNDKIKIKGDRSSAVYANFFGRLIWCRINTI